MRLFNQTMGQITGQIMCLVLMLAAISNVSFAQEANADSETALKAWLALVDEGKVDESLAATSTFFKERVDAENWQQAMKLNHEPLGDLLSREKASSKTATDLPGGPEGEYVIYEFNVEYTNKKHAIETISMVLEDDQWRVIGYYIK